VSTNTDTNWFVTSNPGFGLGGGNYARDSTATSSTTQTLFQDFTLPGLPVVSGTLEWRDRFTSAFPWVDGLLEYRVTLQRVVAETPVGALLEVFSTATTPAVQSAGPTDRGSLGNVTTFVLNNLGQNVRLSFQVIDSGSIPNVAVDNVSFVTVFDTASVPEPSALLLAALPVLGFVVKRGRRSARCEG